MSLNPHALLEFSSVSHFQHKGTATWVSDPVPTQPVQTFGSLVDLARLKFHPAPAEICVVCNTINFGHALYCKGCSHKLPAFYASCEDEPPPPPRRASVLADRASLTDFAAFVLVVNLLVGIAEFMPIQ